MTSSPRDVLIEIVAKHGEALLASALRTEGLLKDYCGEFRREIFVLVSCLRVGVVEQLRRQSGPSVKLVCARLALKLEQNLAISSDVAKWGVESWAIALGLLQPETATARLGDIVDISARLSRLNQPVAELATPVEAVGSEMTPPTVPEKPGQEGETPVLKAPAVEFLAEEPEPGWPVPDWSHPAENAAVYPDASGQRPTLREAVREAAPQTCLLLKPGVYRESLVIKKDLQIRAEGGPGEVVLESVASSVVILDGACLYLARLTLKGIGGKDKKTLAAVEVKSGHLTMEDCDLTSDISTVMEVKGPRSEAILRRCHLHDGKAGGILFQEEAVGYLVDCHLYQNKLSHVVIGKGCSPTFFSCKISHALMAGIYVSEGGEGFIENCDIWGNAVGGVQCRRGGKPHFRHCRISLNERYGVLVAEQGEGFFEQCQIFDNARMGVTISQLSKPRFSGCQIFDNHGEGVEISGAEGELLDCEIFSNEEANVLVKEKSDPRLHRCVIHDGHKEGLQIVSNSEGRFEQCEFFANVLAGVSVAENSKPVFQHCVLHHGIEKGIAVLHGADGQFIDCEITHHGGTAVLVGDKSQPRFERCHILNNQALGVHVDEASAPAFLSCVILQNGGTGFLCTQNGAPRMIEGEIGENGGGGLSVSSQGKGRWEQVQFMANKGDTVLVSDGGRPTLRLCRIEGAEGAGLRFLNQAQGIIEDTEIVGGGGPGVAIEGGANPSLRHVRVSQGKGAGMVVQAFGGGTADHCAATDNAGGDWVVAENARFVRIGC
jgi:nitrous oxidase accessory protein NosD